MFWKCRWEGPIIFNIVLTEVSTFFLLSFLLYCVFPVLVLTSESYFCVFNLCMKELGSLVISPLYTFNWKYKLMKSGCFSAHAAENHRSALTLLCCLPSCCMACRLPDSVKLKQRGWLLYRSVMLYYCLTEQLPCDFWKSNLPWRVLFQKPKHEMYMKYL